jgi:O-antigen/teichoic acid export membrane protein
LTRSYASGTIPVSRLLRITHTASDAAVIPRLPESIAADLRARLAVFTSWLARIFGLQPHSTGQRFLKSLTTLIGTDALVTAVTFGISAWAIRTIGPVEFGAVNLLASVSQLFLSVAVWGIPAGLNQHVAASRQPGGYLSTGVGLGALLSVVVAIAVLVLEPFIRPVIGVPRSVYQWSLAYMVALAGQTLVQSGLAGFQRFKTIALINASSAATFALATATWLLSRHAMSGQQFVALNIGRSTVFALLGIFALRGRFERPSLDAAAQLMHFGTYYALTVGAHFFILASIDNLMLNAFLGPAAVGLYGAYYAAFNIFSSRVLGVFADVLMPTAAAHNDRDHVRRRLTSMYLRLGWVLIPGIALLTRILFAFYGSAFEFRWWTAVLIALSVYLYTAVLILSALMAAEGVEGVRRGLGVSIVAAVTNVGLNALFIPWAGIRGCVVASILTSTVSIVLRNAAVKRQWPFAIT